LRPSDNSQPQDKSSERSLPRRAAAHWHSSSDLCCMGIRGAVHKDSCFSLSPEKKTTWYASQVISNSDEASVRRVNPQQFRYQQWRVTYEACQEYCIAPCDAFQNHQSDASASLCGANNSYRHGMQRLRSTREVPELLGTATCTAARPRIRRFRTMTLSSAATTRACAFLECNESRSAMSGNYTCWQMLVATKPSSPQAQTHTEFQQI